MRQKIILALFSILLSIGFVNSAGIASPYWLDNPLKMYYGDTEIVNLNLQNMVGDKDVTVKVEIKQGGDIATLEKDTYTAKPGTSNTIIPIVIKVPKDYEKQSQLIEIDTKTIIQDQGGMVTLGTGWTTTFNVLISEKPESTYKTPGYSTVKIIIITVIVLVIAFLLSFLLRRKK